MRHSSVCLPKGDLLDTLKIVFNESHVHCLEISF